MDKNEAEEQQQFFINGADNFGFSVKYINYESKKSSQATNGSVDYWGNPVKKEQQQSNPKTPAAVEAEKPKVDFWGNPVK